MKSLPILAIASFLLGTGILYAQPTGLNARLAAKKAETAAMIDEDTAKVMQRASETLRNSGILENALNVEDKIPAFTLPNVFGRDVKIKRLYRKGPLVVVFYRGGWCPYCNMTLAAYQDALDDIKSKGGNLVAITPEKPDAAAQTLKENKLKFEVLIDHDNAVARQFGIVFDLSPELQEVYLKFGIDVKENNATDSHELPLAATYVINRKGKIVYAFLTEDYTKRADPAVIAQILKLWK